MAAPAKLQLLTRSTGEDGFQLHEVLSSQAYLEFRPKRLPASEWEIRAQPRSPDGSRNYILKSVNRDRYLLLGEHEYSLWQQLDGLRSLNEIARTFHSEFGAFDYTMIRQFLMKLYQAGLLEEPPAMGLHRRIAAKQRGRWKTLATIVKAPGRLSFKLTNADRYCTLLYNRGGFLLFNPVAFAAMLALTAWAIFVVFQVASEAPQMAMKLATHPFLSSAIIVAVLVLASVLHVLVHALACKSYGRKVREIGFFFLQGILPTFYADVTDIFMSTRRARVIVDLAGPMVEVVLGSAAFLGAYWCGPGIVQSLSFGAGVLLWESAVLNLYPFNFLEMDGYNIIADLLGMPTLRQHALNLFPSLPQRLRKRKMLSRLEWLQLGYLVLCAVSVTVYLILHLDAIGIEISDWRTGF
jgi:putative peptide zinc metalloprotease protein